MKLLDNARVLGVDIGGANLKLADEDGQCLSCPFPMWTAQRQLGKRLNQLIGELQQRTQRSYQWLGITMTGEMADCFANRDEGVAFILEQASQVFESNRIKVYSLDGLWLSIDAARHDPWAVAASNWHALTAWALRMSRWSPDLQLVLDIGSTTVDIIPVAEGQIVTDARTDRQRLQRGQLVYTGASRTSVASIVSEVMLEQQPCPVVAERFATSDDAFLALGKISADPLDCDTADGRPRTVSCARGRLARMVAEDASRLSTATIDSLAQQIIDAQATQVAQAMVRNVPPMPNFSQAEGAEVSILVSGHGRALAQAIRPHLSFPTRFHWLDELVSPTVARCAPAVAVAWLLAKDLQASHETPIS